MSSQAISGFEGQSIQRDAAGISKGSRLAGRILSGFLTAFLVMDAGMKLFKPPFVVQASGQLGYAESTIVGIGIALLICTVLYVIPRTSVIGAMLLTGYLGGAVASNVRAGTPIFNVVFAGIFAVLVWGGLWLRSQRVREMVGVGRGGRECA